MMSVIAERKSRYLARSLEIYSAGAVIVIVMDGGKHSAPTPGQSHIRRQMNGGPFLGKRRVS